MRNFIKGQKFFWTKIAPLFSLAMMAAPLSFACDPQGVSGIVEENSLYIATDAKSISTITKEKFEEILTKVDKIYAPIFAAKGKKLVIERGWDDGTVNAYASQRANEWVISMFGGLARHDTITEDAFALVACHEIGHHIGGAPKKSSLWGGAVSWASNEGQADYWGTMKCLRRYFDGEDNQAIVQNMNVDPYASQKCHQSFTNADEIAMCERASMAGLSLGNLFKALRNQTTPLRFETPDTSRVTTTNHNHPASQCRLDTYFSSALCEKGFLEEVSNTDANLGVCNERDAHPVGVRPRCWYAPN